MINGLILLFLAYLNPNVELQTTLIDTVYLNSENIEEVEIINDKSDLQRIKKMFGNDVELPKSYFVDETLIIKKLDNGDDPTSFSIIRASKNKEGNYEIFYSIENNDEKKFIENEKMSKLPHVVVKLKPVANKKAKIKFVKIDQVAPVFVNQSVNISPSPYSNVQSQPNEVIFRDFFPLDRGNRWTYIYTDNDSKKEVTSNIVSFTKGWSIFDNFFGKPGLAFQIDNNGKLMTSSKDGIRSFYNDSVNLEQTSDKFSVEAGTFSNVLVVSIPKNNEFWFRDIYARNVGLIYHEHHSPKGSFVYELQNAFVRGKAIPQ